MHLLFVKSHVKGHFRDGKWVKDYDNKVQKKVAQTKGEKKPAQVEAEPSTGKQPSLFGGYFGGKSPSYAKNIGGGFKMAPKAWHPKPDDNGKPMPIHKPSLATPAESWLDPDETATFLPGGEAPKTLNGVALEPWTDHPRTLEGWDYVDGQMDDLDEPGMKLPNGKEPAAGVIVKEPDGRVWIVHPTNEFAGYRATFPKGHADDGLSLQATAIKEAFEESGLKVAITGFLGDVERGQTMTRYYLAKRVGGTPTAMGWESQAVSLAPADEIPDLVNSGFDKKVSALAGFGKPHEVESIADWSKVGKQAGSNPGGFYEDADGRDWYCKFPSNPEIAKNEVLACKLYEAAGVTVPDVKLVADGDQIGVASAVIEGVKQDKAAVTSGKLPGVFDGFAADAWLANWDVAGTGFDNLLVKDGHAVRIDAGGSLAYRAQGGLKGAAFGDKVGEVSTYLDPKNHWSYSVFKGIKESDIADGVKRIAAISDDRIRALVDAYGPGGKRGRAKLADKLIRRKSDLISRFIKK